MKSGLLNINWNRVKEFDDEDISYYLFLEDKSIDSIAFIRNISREKVQEHIILGKMKFGVLSKCKNENELFQYLCKVSKEERQRAFNYLTYDLKKKLVEYIDNNYYNMNYMEKEKSIWILGELNFKEGIKILLKASVHNNVNMRRLAVSALGKMNCEEGEMALIRALEDNNSQVISYAIKSLMKLQSCKAKDKILNILNKTDKEYIRIQCREYLQCEDVREKRIKE